MADQTTQYVIAVTDQISASIGDKLAVIADTAAQAGDEITSLQAAISKLNGNGLSSVSANVRALSTAQRGLTSTTQAYSRASASAVTASNNLALALPRVTAAAQATATAIAALSTQTQGFVGWARAMRGINPAAPLNQTRAAAGATTASVRGLSSGLSLMNGNMRSGNLLVARFASGLLNASGAAAAVMSVFTAVAIVAVIAEMVSSVDKLRQAWEATSEATVKADAAAILEGKHLERIEHSLLSINNLKRAASGQGIQTGAVTYQDEQDQIDQLERTRQIAAAQRAADAQKLTGAAKDHALSLARRADANDELRDAAALTTAAKAYNAQLTARETVHHAAQYTQAQPGSPGYYTSAYDEQVQKVTSKDDQKALEERIRKATDAATALRQNAAVGNINAQGEDNRAGVAQVRDDAKAARKEMEQLTAAYDKYVATLGHKITPPETLQYWTKAADSLKYVAQNQDKVLAKQTAPREQIESRNDTLNRTSEGLDDQIASIGAYSVALKEKQELDKLTIQFQKTGIPLTAQETAALKAKIAVVQEGTRYQSALNSMYQAATGPQRDYTANVAAIIKLMGDDAGNAQRYGEELSKITREYLRAQNPMIQFEERLKNQQELLGKTPAVSAAIQQIQQLEEQYKALGKTLDPAQKQGAYNSVLNASRAQEASKQYGSLTGADQSEGLQAQQAAAAAAFENSAISADRYRAALVGIATAQAELANNNGMATWATTTQAIFGQITKGYTSFTGGATKAFGQFFTTLTDGFADAIGHALVFGGSVSKALLNVARQAVAGLISALIKLGIQWVVTKALGDALQAGTAATTSVVAGTVAAAWAPAAALASLATVGTNAAAADTALTTTVALSDALAIFKFAGGGRVVGPGTSTSDSIPALLSNGEYVVKASAYAAHRNAIEAINAGATNVTSRANGAPNGTYNNSGGMHIEFHDHAGVALDVQQLDEDSVRVLINKQVPAMIQAQAPSAVASAIANPNSKPSIALKTHTNVTRRR